MPTLPGASLIGGYAVRSRTTIVIAVAVVLVAALAGGVYAYDNARSDKIGKGVRVDGVSLQGLTRAEARAKVQRLILQPPARPMGAPHAPKTWPLTPREGRIAVDLDAIVDDAMQRSQEGNIISRTV